VTPDPSTPDTARAALAAWRAAVPRDPWGHDALGRALVDRDLTGERRRDLHETARAFGRAVIEVIGPAATRYEHRLHLPEAVRWDGLGHRVEAVAFDPAYHRAGAEVWGSGVVALAGEPGRSCEQAVLLGLLSLEGEAGHACPATCTVGLARALRRRATPEVRDRFLPPLLERDLARAERASQFLTEVQGGSDVGANTTRAEPAGDGTWLITGEKWFCSVADAEQFLLTARVPGTPPGTRGLGCFVVPRTLEGRPNGFALRRLKEKLGTRGMASAEIDFDGARAWPVGPVEEGFRTAVGIVLNTSRWLTAVGSVGMMRRATLEAQAYAAHRAAFGRRIGDFPATQATLARMAAETLAAQAAVWRLTLLDERGDREEAAPEEQALHRLLVNALKLHTSQAATRVVRDAIEVLGGNGTIEDFSVLPRLYRDCIVYESWEGTHNVLVAQILHDCGRLDLLGACSRHLAALARSAGPEGATAAALGERAVRGLGAAAADPLPGAVAARRWLEVLARTLGALELWALRAAPPASVPRDEAERWRAAGAWQLAEARALAERPDPGVGEPLLAEPAAHAGAPT
jgi:alkylation response protein AidB-like acyl-CoA dehydrogenase